MALGGKPADEKRIVPRDERGRILPGATPNPSGKAKRIREFEAMLEREHQNVENLRVLFERLRDLAMGELVNVHDKKTGKVVGITLRADPAFMKLYLERVLGPVADDDAVVAKAEKMLRALLEEAEAEARKNRQAIDVEVK